MKLNSAHASKAQYCHNIYVHVDPEIGIIVPGIGSFVEKISLSIH